MTDDWDSNSSFDFDNDAAVFYSVPSDHPAFRGPEDDDESDGELGQGPGVDGSDIAFGGDIIQLPVGRYDGFSGEGQPGNSRSGYQDSDQPIRVPGDGDARKRAADQQYIREQLEQRRREGGSRSIREHAVARQHQSGAPEGERVSRADPERGPTTLGEQLAASLEQAGIALRDEWKLPGGTRSDTAAVGSYISSSDEVKEQGGRNKPITTVPLLTKSPGIKRTPDFERAVLRGQLSGLKSNSSGSWVVTLVIDPDCVEDITKMGSAHGLALDILVSRKVR